MKIILLLSMLMFSVLCNAKTEFPEWMDTEKRDAMYPSSAYYNGFAVAELSNDESIEETMERLRQSAYGDLLSKISVTVEHHASDSVRDVVGTDQAYSQSVYSSTTTLTTRMTELPGVEVKRFMDHETKVAAVLVYVKRAGLAMRLQRQLITQITRINVRLEDADNYLLAGERSKAREAVTNARDVLRMADDTRYTMMAIEPELTAEDLMDNEWRAAEMKIIALEGELSRSVRIMLSCRLKGETDNSLMRTVSGELYRNGCEVVDSAGNAEWTVEITAKVEPFNHERIEGYSFYYSYATATLKIVDNEGRVAYSDEMRSKGAHTKSYKYSSDDALRRLSVRLSEIIKSTVQR